MIYRLPVKRPWVTRGWPGIVVTCSIESVPEKKVDAHQLGRPSPITVSFRVWSLARVKKSPAAEIELKKKLVI